MAHTFARHQAVRVPLLQVPVGHAVVEQDARLTRDQARTEARLDTLENADQISRSIRCTKAGGVFVRFRSAGRDIDGSAPQIDSLGLLSRIRLR